MSAETCNAATTAFKLGKAFDHLKKVEKLFEDLRMATPNVREELAHLQDFCNEKVLELKENT